MQTDKGDKIVDNLLSLAPNIHNTLICSVSSGCNITPFGSQYKILMALDHFGDMPVSEIAKKLSLSKPNMTLLTNRLIKEGMVKRSPSPKDRRVVKIVISPKGKSFIKESKRRISLAIKENLKQLDQKDINTLDNSLININRIILKIKH